MNNGGGRRFGVDGCRAGWFHVWIDGSTWGHGVTPTIATVAMDPAAGIVLVDIPIGLLDTPGHRGCDTAARRCLGPRAASVFPAPCRPALAATSYREACDVNERQTGRRLSRQCWGIVGKIREVDDFLRSRLRRQRILRESHPELCFAALNCGVPMSSNKKTSEGFAERRDVLTRHWPAAADVAADSLAVYRRRDVARDDVLDAMVLAVTANLPETQRETIPAVPRRDAAGFAMEMIRATVGPERAECTACH